LRHDSIKQALHAKKCQPLLKKHLLNSGSGSCSPSHLFIYIVVCLKYVMSPLCDNLMYIFYLFLQIFIWFILFFISHIIFPKFIFFPKRLPLNGSRVTGYAKRNKMHSLTLCLCCILCQSLTGVRPLSKAFCRVQTLPMYLPNLVRKTV